MNNVLAEADEIPVTLVVALAYGTLAVVTNMFGPGEEFVQNLHTFGWLTPGLATDGQAWRLLSHAFLHGGIVHLVFNLTSLFALGPALERSLGSVRFALLYVLSALGGGLAVCVCYEPGQPVVGGSGALFGMMGAVVAMNMRSGRHAFAFLDFEGPRRFLGTIVLNLVLGFALTFVSNTAHIGGLLAGFVVTFLWLRPGDGNSPLLKRWRLATTALFAGLLFASLVPVTRFDWLLQQADATADMQQREALLRAAVRALPPSLRPAEQPPRKR